MLPEVSAVGGVFQVVKTLYDFYSLYKRNQALLDILEGFTQNLEVSIERLNVREELLTGKRSAALESIGKDFENAQRWLLANDKNLRSKWTAIQAADKLKDLDDRLTKAFASKMSVALFSALQDSAVATTQIQTTLDGMQGNIESAIREASDDNLKEIIKVLKEEAYQATGGGGKTMGFSNGEAEKIISQLVDQLSAQELLREEADLAGFDQSTVRERSPSSYQASSISSAQSSIFEPQNSRRPHSSRSASYSESTFTDRSKGKTRAREIPQGCIVFDPVDPLTGGELIDPVLASDGLIHDRFTLIRGNHANMRDPNEPLIILGEVAQLREAIFQSFPLRKLEYEARRSAFKQETLDRYNSASYLTLPHLVPRLSHILLWEPQSISIRVRRAITYYRLRELEVALKDLNDALQISTRRSTTHGPARENMVEPDLDALRIRALVKHEMNDSISALVDINLLLSLSPNDILVLSLRASIRGSAGDVEGAKQDVSSANLAATNETDYRSEKLGDWDNDLDFLARGWAYIHIDSYSSAEEDFSWSIGLRPSTEPYTLACRGLARIHSNKDDEGFGDLNEAIRIASSLGQETEDNIFESVSRKSSSGADALWLSAEGLPRSAFGCYFLRGMAFFARQECERALDDFTVGLKLRPNSIKDTADLRAVLGEVKMRLGDREGASVDFDNAIAIAGNVEEKENFRVLKASFGL